MRTLPHRGRCRRKTTVLRSKHLGQSRDVIEIVQRVDCLDNAHSVFIVRNSRNKPTEFGIELTVWSRTLGQPARSKLTSSPLHHLVVFHGSRRVTGGHTQRVRGLPGIELEQTRCRAYRAEHTGDLGTKPTEDQRTLVDQHTYNCCVVILYDAPRITQWTREFSFISFFTRE